MIKPSDILEKTRTAWQKATIIWTDYCAEPARQAGRNIAACTMTPARDFFKCLREGIRSDEAYPLMRRIMREMTGYDAEGYTAAIAWIGLVGGGLGAAAGGWFGAAALGAGHIGMGLTAAAVTGLGVLAGPFVLAGLVTLGGFVAGCSVGSALGIVDGSARAWKMRSRGIAQTAATQALPGLKDMTPDIQETSIDIFEKLGALPEGYHAPVLKSLAEKYAAQGQNATERIVKEVETMTLGEREVLAHALNGLLSDSFTAATQKKAQNSVELQKPVITSGPLKLKIPKKAQA